MQEIPRNVTEINIPPFCFFQTNPPKKCCFVGYFGKESMPGEFLADAYGFHKFLGDQTDRNRNQMGFLAAGKKERKKKGGGR